MGQSLVGGLIGGAAGAFQGFITGGPAKALALGAIGFVGGFASSYMAKQATADALSSAMGPSATEPKFGGYNVNRRGAALHHQVIYGQTKVGGVVVFDDAHGTNNEDLSRIIAYAGHEIESFEKIYLGQYELTLSGDNVTSAQQIDANGDPVGSSTTKFNNYLKIRKVTGGHTTSLNGTFSGFSSEWTSSHKLLGIAHLAIIFTYADDVWDEGLPEVTALIKGKKVYDPRKDITSSVYDSSLGVSTHRADTESTWEWSDNPALIVRDFLTNTDYGLGEDTANIDDTLVDSSADRCDETVNVTDPDNPPATIASSRYTCNGAWTTSQPPVDVIAQLMTSCAGYLWYAQGKWRMKAGEDTTPVKTLTEDDLRSPISVTTRHSRRDNFNAVRGTFRGPSTNYQFTDYPTVTSTNFVFIDGGLESTMDLALPFTDTPYEAQRLANIALEKNRSQITITGTFGLNAFDLQVGDIVSFTNSRFGWTNERFEVVAWSFGVEDYQLQVNLVLRSITATTYDAISDVTGFESADTNLPGALGEVVVGGGVNETASATGLTAEGGLRQIKLSWTNPINNNYFKTVINKTDNISGIITSRRIGEVEGGESFIDTGGLDLDNIDGPFSVDSNFTTQPRYYSVKAVDSNGDLLSGGSATGWVSASLKRSNTPDLINNAVSEQEDDQSTTEQSIATGPFSWTTVATCSNVPNPTGADILVQFTATVDADNGDLEYAVRLTRNGSDIWNQYDIPIHWNTADRKMIAGSYRDTGAVTGNNTYRLQFQRESGSSGSLAVENRMLIATELKK